MVITRGCPLVATSIFAPGMPSSQSIPPGPCKTNQVACITSLYNNENKSHISITVVHYCKAAQQHTSLSLPNIYMHAAFCSLHPVHNGVLPVSNATPIKATNALVDVSAPWINTSTVLVEATITARHAKKGPKYIPLLNTVRQNGLSPVHCVDSRSEGRESTKLKTRLTLKLTRA